MKKLFSLGWIGMAVILLSGCTTLRPYSFDRLQAADVSFPEQVRSVAVINYMPPASQIDKSVEYMGEHLEGEGKAAAEVLAQEIAATNYFEQVIICDSALREQSRVVDEAPMPGGKVDSLMKALDVDLLFAIERIPVQLKEGSLFISEAMMTVPVIDGIVEPLVRVYATGRETPLFTVHKTDTICWEQGPALTYGQMIKEASEYAATLPVNYLLPHWEDMSRYYFDGGDVDMRDAGVYVFEDNWEEASALWQKVYAEKKGKKKMRAAFNLALYHELNNDFGKAKEYLSEAASLAKEDSWEAKLILFYSYQLEEQSNRNRLLELQMKRFESQK